MTKFELRNFTSALVIFFLQSCQSTALDQPVDTDGDGWSDEYERQIGTDPFSREVDSDFDGLPDLLEQRLGTNPNSSDSDGNGELDGAEDADGDGVSNLDELRLGLDPNNEDSNGNGISDDKEDADGDGISNSDELDREGTDPLNPDTDGDGVSDLDETMRLDLDPNNPDSDGDGVIDGDDPFNTPPNSRDALIVKRVGWECVSGLWHLREWHTYVRYFYDAVSGAFIRSLTLNDILVLDRAFEDPCGDNLPPPSMPEIQA